MAQALPQAYANAKEMGKFAGEKAEEWCHKQFEEPPPKP
jgi:hypothetical protein